MAESLQGKFLVATRQLRDPNFYRTVVLLLEHSQDSAMGLVINRPSSISMDTAMEKLKVPTKFTDPIYAGGPVETSALFILHSCQELGKLDVEVADGVFVTGSHDSFESLVSKGASCSHDCAFRIYCGYSGWGADQLEGEIQRGDWRLMPAECGIVFQRDPYDIWEQCTQRLQELGRMLPHDIRNADWN